MWKREKKNYLSLKSIFQINIIFTERDHTFTIQNDKCTCQGVFSGEKEDICQTYYNINICTLYKFCGWQIRQSTLQSQWTCTSGAIFKYTPNLISFIPRYIKSVYTICTTDTYLTLGGFLKSFSYIKNNKITKTYLSELSAGKKKNKKIFVFVFLCFFLFLFTFVLYNLGMFSYYVPDTKKKLHTKHHAIYKLRFTSLLFYFKCLFCLHNIFFLLLFLKEKYLD